MAVIGACGDNVNPNLADANRLIDSSGQIDAMPPDAMIPATRSAVLAITDVILTDPEVAALGGVRGGAASLVFSDVTMGGGSAVFGTSPIGGCVVTEFTPANRPNPSLDGGTITMANEPAAEVPATGLLKTVGPCTFQASSQSYRCSSHGGVGQTAVATDIPNPGAVAYTFPTQVFPAGGMVGSYLNVNGFADASLNSGASAFPIVGQMGASTLIVVNPPGSVSPGEGPITTASFLAINAFQPVPAAGAGADFLGMGQIRVTKPSDPDWPAIDQIVGLQGEGFTLDTGTTPPSSDVDNLPLVATGGLHFSCDGVDDVPGNGDDTCGDTITAPTTLTAMIISGRATQKPLAGLMAFQMPTENPATDTWREFQCAFLLARTADMPAAAYTFVLGTEVPQPAVPFNPTRIEMRILRVAGAISNGPGPGDVMTGRVLVGHGLVGHTDP